MSNVQDARREMTKTKEQLEEEKKISLSIRIKPLELDSKFFVMFCKIYTHTGDIRSSRESLRRSIYFCKQHFLHIQQVEILSQTW